MCTTSEECEMVNTAKESMKEIENTFKIPKERYWFDDKKTEKQPAIESQQLSDEAFMSVQENSAKIENVIGWDIESSCHDETDLNIVKNARQAFAELKEMLK
jgi:hypothetical protein